jgi:ubiquinone/menaquinone biosynthesis C-methylase UbiE
MVMAASATQELPEYAAELADFHRAFADDLQELIEILPLTAEMQVLDIGCGDGFYTELLARRLGPGGGVTAIDSCAGYIELARRRLSALRRGCTVRFIQQSLEGMEWLERRFDLVWCAQSLYSFPQPIEALQSMFQVLRPGGMIAVLENDTLHQLLLPWPARVEIALRSVEYAALNQESAEPAKYYIGRRLPAVLAEAGFTSLGFRTQSIDRYGADDRGLKQFLQAYLQRLEERVGPMLDESHRQRLEELIDVDSPNSLLNQPHFTMSWLNVLAWGRRPEPG